MVLTIFLCLISVGKLPFSLAAPARESPSPYSSGIGKMHSLQRSMPNVHEFDYTLPTQTITPQTNADLTPQASHYPILLSFAPTPIVSSIPAPTGEITTVTTTEIEPTTITVLPPPTTITEFFTITESIVLPKPSPPSRPAPGVGPAKEIWVAPTTMDDLSQFKVSKFVGSKQNFAIINGIPSQASVRPTAAKASSANGDSLTTWDNAGSAMQILYPEGSISPGHDPQGGIQFYASPLDLSSAKNVTLTYSVFFPENFEWVLAGKMPGLYGGHSGCSGGNAALDCFSTRLMWRRDGAGELYCVFLLCPATSCAPNLTNPSKYAPKDKQTNSLCSDPQSTCNVDYGLSVGRGSFKWTAGQWTTVQQTVSLNTPGLQDGGFTLDVNGKRVIDRNDVYYRGDSSSRSKGERTSRKSKSTPTPIRVKPTSTKHLEPTSTPVAGGSGGLLGPILGGLLGGLGLRDQVVDGQEMIVQQRPWDVGRMHLPWSKSTSQGRTEARTSLLPVPAATTPILAASKTASPSTSTPTPTENSNTFRIESSSKDPVAFVGIFFSTFFGGHDSEYATPKDQYAWFKDFALAYNS